MPTRHLLDRRLLLLTLISIVTVAGGASNAPAQFRETVHILHEWQGEAPYDRMGTVVRWIGDVNGDGVADVAIGAPNRDESGVDAGKVYVRSGGDGSLIRSHLGLPGENLGNEIAGVGDMNGDDVPDYLVGAPAAGAGRAILYSGCDGSEIKVWTGENPGDGFGRIVSGGGDAVHDGVGDIDGDGIPDVLIGAPSHDATASDAGRVYVYSGADLDTAVLIVDGFVANEQFGFAIGGIGDLDEDGTGDFVVGAHQGTTGFGRAYVHSGADGALLLPRLEPGPTGRSFGLLFASGPGDVNQDGTPDIFVTDIADVARGTNTGRAYVFSGVDGSLLLDWTGSAAGEGLGVGRGCGDVDFDGHPDLLVCAFSSSHEVTNGGRAFIFSGQDGRLLRKMTDTRAFDYFGWSANALGDIDDDGSIDFVISAPISTINGLESGRVFVIAGDIFPCDADIDADGMVTFGDILAILGAWGPCSECPEDLDGDGIVAFNDILVVQGAWGTCN